MLAVASTKEKEKAIDTLRRATSKTVSKFVRARVAFLGIV